MPTPLLRTDLRNLLRRHASHARAPIARAFQDVAAAIEEDRPPDPNQVLVALVGLLEEEAERRARQAPGGTPTRATVRPTSPQKPLDTTPWRLPETGVSPRSHTMAAANDRTMSALEISEGQRLARRLDLRPGSVQRLAGLTVFLEEA